MDSTRSASLQTTLRIGVLLLGLLAGLYLLWMALAALILRLSLPTLSLFGHTLYAPGRPWTMMLGVVPTILVLPGIFAAELAMMGWKRSSLHLLLLQRPRSGLVDLITYLIWHSSLVSVLTALTTLGLSLISGAWLHARLVASTGWSLELTSLPIPLQAVLYFLVFSFLDYWEHRVDHSRLMWPLHRFHHAAEDFCILTTTRVHPAVFSNFVMLTLPLALLGISPEAVVAVNLFTNYLRCVIHSRMETNFGWIGRWVLQSPVHHRLHHVRDTKVPVGHFSLVPLWDRLFGTWRGDATQDLVIGVDTPYRQGWGFVHDLIRDYQEFLHNWQRLPLRLLRRATPEQVEPAATGLG